jgi:hypothetical protein
MARMLMGGRVGVGEGVRVGLGEGVRVRVGEGVALAEGWGVAAGVTAWARDVLAALSVGFRGGLAWSLPEQAAKSTTAEARIKLYTGKGRFICAFQFT